MYAYRLAYDGHGFAGFQRQPDVRTIEGVLFEALEAHGVAAGGRPKRYTAAGRTDAGVSALAQTVAFEAPAWLSARALNAELSASIRAWARCAVDPDFHATREPRDREYVYHLYEPALDATAATHVLERLSGTHDFCNLSAASDRTVRTVSSATIERRGRWFQLTFRADGFVHQQVRRMVGLVAAVGTGERPMDDVDVLLSGEPVDGPMGVAPAPAAPLVLTDVAYPHLRFEPDDRAVEATRRAFEDRFVAVGGRARAVDLLRRRVGESP